MACPSLSAVHTLVGFQEADVIVLFSLCGAIRLVAALSAIDDGRPMVCTEAETIIYWIFILMAILASEFVCMDFKSATGWVRALRPVYVSVVYIGFNQHPLICYVSPAQLNVINAVQASLLVMTTGVKLMVWLCMQRGTAFESDETEALHDVGCPPVGSQLSLATSLSDRPPRYTPGDAIKYSTRTTSGSSLDLEDGSLDNITSTASAFGRGELNPCEEMEPNEISL